MHRALVALVVLVLVGAVAYLAVDVNHRRYRLTAVDGQLVVERGRNLPVGFEPYRPESEALRAAYAPIPLPPGTGVNENDVYTERSDLDRALFGLLAGWAHNRLASTDDHALDLASTYLARAELLPGLSEEQRGELHSLRGDLAYHHALAQLERVGTALRGARSELELARRYGSADPRGIESWIADIDRLLGLYGGLEPRLRAAAGERTRGRAPGDESAGEAAPGGAQDGNRAAAGEGTGAGAPPAGEGAAAGATQGQGSGTQPPGGGAPPPRRD